MTGQDDPAPRYRDPHEHEEAHVQQRHFSFVWLIPIVAALIAAWLGYRTLTQRGPLITITFKSGDGLAADQTPVKYKAVQLGTVDSVRLSQDMTHVVVRVRMRSEAEDRLTSNARFWVVRPRISSGNISGLETLVSGAYIAMDPGDPGGQSKQHFTGLENPPGHRSDEPGTTYTLKADTIGSLGQGSPVFYRDIGVGEVLGYDQPGLDGKITVHVFVRAPYDKYVRADSRFWNASGVKVNFGGGGVKVRVESLQAVLSGGIAFATPPEARDEQPAKQDSSFTLYKDFDSALSATSHNRINLVSYFTGSVRGLDSGSAVEIDGMRIGSVTHMRLEYDAATGQFRVPVHMAIEPDKLAFVNNAQKQDLHGVLDNFLRRGMQAELQTSSYLTGAMVVELTVPDNARPGAVRMDGNELVVPGQSGGVDGIITSFSSIAQKLDKIPFDEIGSNLNGTLASVHQLVAGPDMRRALRDLSDTLHSVRSLTRKTDRGLEPVLKQLPQMEANLNRTLQHANELLGRQGYGGDSQFHRDVERLMNQANDTLRAVRSLADFLDRHPEALIRGRAGEAMRR